MQETSKEATVKGYGNKKHKMKIKKTTMGGYTFYEFSKNGTTVLNCEPREFVKLKKLFMETL